MKTHSLIVLATVATLLIGLGSLASVQGSDTVVAVDGKTVLFELDYDLQLRVCDPAHTSIPCSLPPGAELYLPDYFDITKAAITQIGRGMVDLSIDLIEPIPAEPPYPYINYFWQFKGGCVVSAPGNKTSISIVWKDWEGNGTREWRAYWFKITNCDPRIIIQGEPIPFIFTDSGVKVRVALADLLTARDPDESLMWHVGVRRIPFDYPPYTHAVGVDYSPDVVEFNLTPPPDIIESEGPTAWVPRIK
jgi:hypothetical protein